MDLFVWADDIVVCAGDRDTLFRKLESLLGHLGDIDLKCKPGSLAW
jgi:hypothetical protein